MQRFMRFNELTIFNPTIPTWDCVSLRVHRTSQKISQKDLQKEMNEEFELITVTISLAATAKRKQLSNCHRQTSFQCSHAKLRFVSARDFIYLKILFRWFEEKRMVFQAKQALVFKAMYQSAFSAREKVLNFDGWLSDFESTTLNISLKISCWQNRELIS